MIFIHLEFSHTNYYGDDSCLHCSIKVLVPKEWYSDLEYSETNKQPKEMYLSGLTFAQRWLIEKLITENKSELGVFADMKPSNAYIHS
jgi:hypothetical protein